MPKKIIRQGDKCAFVRSLPRSMPASVVREKAAKKGMEMSIAYIHNIRSAAGKKSREILKKTKRATVKGTKAQKENAFRNLVVALGPARAKALLTQVEVALAQEAS
jgi:hypothetical protein